MKMLSGLILITLLSGCIDFSTSLDTSRVINLGNIKRGEACAGYLFGGLKAPYIGSLSIRLNGDESATTALLKAKITKPFGKDTISKNYLFYKKSCTIVIGE